MLRSSGMAQSDGDQQNLIDERHELVMAWAAWCSFAIQRGVSVMVAWDVLAQARRVATLSWDTRRDDTAWKAKEKESQGGVNSASAPVSGPPSPHSTSSFTQPYQTPPKHDTVSAPAAAPPLPQDPPVWPTRTCARMCASRANMRPYSAERDCTSSAALREKRDSSVCSRATCSQQQHNTSRL